MLITALDRCRRCYSCVRRCPAKAIRVQGGQAEVLAERCISCGRCASVCSQGARHVASNVPRVLSVLASGNTALLLAPSFPAAFSHWSPGQVIAALRRTGFVAVHEVAFGADLVGAAYRKIRGEQPHRLMVTTPCPAAVAYVRKYAVELLPMLAPVLSPMATMGKVVKGRLRPGCSTVFAGPCTAKIAEAREAEVSPWVDAVVTFQELPELFARQGVDPGSLPGEEFDPPHSYLGGIFPVIGGLTRAAEIRSDLLENTVSEVSGPGAFIDLAERLMWRVREHQLDSLETRLFDALFCTGCIRGPAMPSNDTSALARKEKIVSFMRSRQHITTREKWEAALASFSDLDLSRTFLPDDKRRPAPTPEEIRRILALTGKHTPADELNCGVCGYRSCRAKAVAVFHDFAEVEMCLPFLINRLEAMITRVNRSHEQLTEAQAQLLRSERLASMGQLAAGIAHEVNNPLGTILIYAHLLTESTARAEALNPDDIKGDVRMILTEATRCKSIVSGLLDFARQNKVTCAPTPLRTLLDEAVHIVKAQTADPRIRFVINCSSELPDAPIDKQQVLQVLLNLARNSVEAMPDGGTVTLSGDFLAPSAEFRIRVSDEGQGIAPESMDKLFSPFFTTKAVGKGTGLGLPICYGIVKMHRGAISAVNNTDGRGVTFEIRLPAVAACTENATVDQLLDGQSRSFES